MPAATTSPIQDNIQDTISIIGQLAMDWESSILQPPVNLTSEELKLHYDSLAKRGSTVGYNMDLGGWVNEEDGITPLHKAASVGNKVAVEWLLAHGHSWNCVDKQGKSVGECAKEANHDDIYELLVQEGCRAELILGLLDRQQDMDKKASNQEYLDSTLKYTDGLLVDGKTDAVMMGWESCLMKYHADIISPRPGLDVLNVGFGLGIIDRLIQATEPRRHVIIEAHPDVYAKMIEEGWDKKPNVEIFFGRWQDHIEQVGCFDGIFWDTFGEFYDDLREFNEHVPNLLRDEHSIYSFFNGLAGTNSFFHDVYSRIARMDLEEKGITTEYRAVPVPQEIENKGTWDDIRRRYFSLDVYQLPICKLDI